MKILLSLLTSKDGDELFEKVKRLLEKVGIGMYDERGVEKSLYALCCEVAEIINKE